VALANVSETRAAGVALAVAVAAVSTSAILIRWSDAPSVVQAFYRVVFTVALLAPLTARRYTADLQSLPRRELGVLAVTGALLAAHFALWFESLRWTTVAASVTLVQSQPLFVAVGAALLLNERFTRRTTAGAVVALAGTAVLSFGSRGSAVAPRPLYGGTLAVLAAAAFAGYVIVGRSFRQRLALLPYVTVVYAACALALGVAALVAGLPLASYPPHEWLLFLAMAVGPGILGHTLINWALAHLESGVVSVTLVAEPVASAALAAVLLGEIPGVATVLGGAVVLAGVAVTASGR
jgi:drug/metabolite transporter (DMT)-like permease